MAGGENPFSGRVGRIFEAEDYSTLPVLLGESEDQTARKAMHTGILQYVVSRQARDFLKDVELRLNPWEVNRGRTFQYKESLEDLSVEDHHIIPLAEATELEKSSKELRKMDAHMLNSPLNRTYITTLSNRLIRNKSPEQYLDYLEDFTQWGHCLPPYAEMRRGGEEEPADYYRRILTRRFHEIKNRVAEELGGLV